MYTCNMLCSKATIIHLHSSAVGAGDAADKLSRFCRHQLPREKRQGGSALATTRGLPAITPAMNTPGARSIRELSSGPGLTGFSDREKRAASRLTEAVCPDEGKQQPIFVASNGLLSNIRETDRRESAISLIFSTRHGGLLCLKGRRNDRLFSRRVNKAQRNAA